MNIQELTTQLLLNSQSSANQIENLFLGYDKQFSELQKKQAESLGEIDNLNKIISQKDTMLSNLSEKLQEVQTSKSIVNAIEEHFKTSNLLTPEDFKKILEV